MLAPNVDGGRGPSVYTEIRGLPQGEHVRFVLLGGNIDGSRDALFLNNYAIINIIDVISRIKGVGEARLFGQLNYSMRIWYDTDALTAWKDERLIRAQREGAVDDGILPAGNVSGAITDLIHVAEFVPALVEEAVAVLESAARRATAVTAGGHER